MTPRFFQSPLSSKFYFKNHLSTSAADHKPSFLLSFPPPRLEVSVEVGGAQTQGSMATPEATSLVSAYPVRICKIAGRYLVFDPTAVAMLRRKYNINGTLVGTTPQQPTQNIFLGLPVELRPEEADVLVRRKAAYVVDDVAAHRAALLSPNKEARRAYAESLLRRKQGAQQALAEKSTKKAADVAGRLGLPKASVTPACSPSNAVHDGHGHPPGTEAEPSARQTAGRIRVRGLTPASSGDLISRDVDSEFDADETTEGPLCRFLQGAGYYMTPGLRFGAQYSVYPGDPLRFHAHFMANQYDWNEEIPILDVVSGGRLATAVKKAFLIGGQRPQSEESPSGPRSESRRLAAASRHEDSAEAHDVPPTTYALVKVVHSQRHAAVVTKAQAATRPDNNGAQRALADDAWRTLTNPGTAIDTTWPCGWECAPRRRLAA
ncbi:putative tRNA-splicing endonuclease subunit tsp-4 [Tolypocladium ophioglossoides CBS 100239]|uniref:tRNA-intron lyase n=1 Tax=Tolypocladium ophioglossoides (strain CBS 100239) TaxID=1163406 RepID=A0A0L0NBA4_TOLOC|nr:putative tRNA-splicing endonuclease subunit tsp-4 [Tolypocladium ophioglossoides CBS 100239]